MKFRFKILWIKLLGRLYRFRYLFMRFTWRRLVFPIYHLYMGWIEREFDKGHIKSGDFIMLPKDVIDYNLDDRHFGNERHRR